MSVCVCVCVCVCAHQHTGIGWCSWMCVWLVYLWDCMCVAVHECVCICGTVFKEYPCLYFVQNSKTRPEDNFKGKWVLLILKMGRKYVLLVHAQNNFLSCNLSLRDQGRGLWASHLRSLGFPFLISYSECVGLSGKGPPGLDSSI